MIKKLLLLGFLVSSAVSIGQIEAGMIAHFPFDNNLDDLSSSNVQLTGSGVTFGAGRTGAPNSAVVFDGTGSIAFNDADLRVSFPISLSFWVNLNSIQPITNPVFWSEDQFNNYSGYFVAINPNGNVAMHMGDGSGEGTGFRRSFVSDLPLSTGVWYHITCIYRSFDDMSIYIDCNESTGNYSGGGNTTMAYLSVGGSMGYEAGVPSTPDRYSDLSLDQMAIWDRELTSNEIMFLCDSNNTLTIDEAELSSSKELVKIVDLLGRETEFTPNTPLIYWYSDGSSEKVFHLE